MWTVRLRTALGRPQRVELALEDGEPRSCLQPLARSVVLLRARGARLGVAGMRARRWRWIRGGSLTFETVAAGAV